MKRFFSIALLLCGFAIALPQRLLAQETPAELMSGSEAPAPVIGRAGVGMTATLSDVLLPGAELRVKPDVGGRRAVALRITAAYPHGTAGFRYRFVWSAYEAGRHNLADYLERADGGEATELPPVMVEAEAILPPGPPASLAAVPVTPPRLGGYRTFLVVAGGVWLAGLVALWYWRRPSPAIFNAEEVEIALPLADRLRPLLEQARVGSLDDGGRARLDRLVLGFWRERLGLESKPMPEAIRELRAHPEAGLLLRRVEEWLHSGRPPESDAAIADLLAPYLDRAPAVGKGPATYSLS